MGAAGRLKRFLLAVLLWLPAAFFIWFLFAGFWVWVPAWLTRLSLGALWPTLFVEFHQHGHLLEAVTGMTAEQAGRGVGQVVLELDVLMFGYSLPLLAGLVLATPNTWARRLAQLAAALPVLWLAQALGVSALALKLVQFDSGPQGAAMAAAAGISPSLLALCYQFGYLILPAMLPVLLWVVMNRRYIAQLSDVTEPGVTDSGLN